MRTSQAGLCAALLLGVAGVACSHTSPLFGPSGTGGTGQGVSSGSSTSTSQASSSGHGGSTTATSSSGLGGTLGVGGSSGHGGESTSTGSLPTSTASSTASATGSTSSSGGKCVVTNANVDMDGDGWAPADGDCNDCDPSVNPGAIDVPNDPAHVDHDCSGKYDPPVPCDTGLALDDVDANDAAKTIDLCQTTTASPPLAQKTWGVISAQYVRADGTVFAPGLQVGVQSAWGTNVHPQAGANMLGLSSGHARTTTQTGACGMNSCVENTPGTPPAGFPQNIAACPPAATIADDVALELTLRVPTNAIGYSFSFRFYSMEFPYWICQAYNDQFVVLASPAPAGATNGNIVFDANGYPASPSFSFFDVCDPSQVGMYAAGCVQAGTTTCPTAPSPYCPSGDADLLGTGFDVWDTMYGNGGATVWLTTQAPVQGGSEITLRFIIWDGGDQNFDSTALIDNFQWITKSGTVAVGTTPAP